MLSDEQKQRIAAQDERIAATLRNIDHRVIVLSGKGGVGKTTVSVNLAALMQSRGHSTGLLDADVTGPNVPKMLGLSGQLAARGGKIEPLINNGMKVVSVGNMVEPGQPIVWRGPMRSKLLHQLLADVEWGRLGFLVVDLPPGTGDEIITIARKMKPGLAIIVTTPQTVALVDSERAINMAKKVKIPHIAVIENMSGLTCPACGTRIDIFGAGGGQLQAQQLKVAFLGALPIEMDARRLADEGRPAVMAIRDSCIARAMNEIAGRIEKMMESPCRVKYVDSRG